MLRQQEESPNTSHQSADLVGTVGVRYNYACFAQWVIRLWLRARKSIPLEPNGEMSFNALFCSFQVEGSVLLIYRKEMGMDCQQGAHICKGGGHLRGTSVKAPCLSENYVDSLAHLAHF